MRLHVLVEAALGQGHGVDAVGHHLLDGLGVVLLVGDGFLLPVPPLKNHPLAVFVELPFFHVLRDVHGVRAEHVDEVDRGVVALQVEQRDGKVDP